MENCLFLCPQFCHVEQLTIPEDFYLCDPKTYGHQGLSELQKGKTHSQEHYFVSSHKVPKREDWLGVERRRWEKMSSSPLGIVEGGISSLLLLWVLWCDLGPKERVSWWNFKGFSYWRGWNTWLYYTEISNS